MTDHIALMVLAGICALLACTSIFLFMMLNAATRELLQLEEHCVELTKEVRARIEALEIATTTWPEDQE